MTSDLVSTNLGQLGRLLLVEDNPGDADYIAELLGDRDCSLEAVATLAAARQRLAAQDYAAVLLDLRLPDGEGTECVEAIISAGGRRPIVVLTGMDEDQLALACLEAGAQDYLAKSDLKASTLVRSLRYAMARAREAEQSARAERLQAMLAGIVEASSDAILSGSADGKLTSWNAAAGDIFGYPHDDVIGQPSNRFLKATDIGNAIEQRGIFAAALRGERAPTREIDVVSRDGTPMTLAVTAFGFAGEAGSDAITHFGAICHDVTERREQEERLMVQYELLRHREQQMRQLAARLNTVREDEQTRIARTVHDELGQKLTALKLDVWWLKRRLTGPGAAIPDDIDERLGETDKVIASTIDTVQCIAADLRPSSLDVLGLAAAMEDEVHRFERRTGIEIDCAIDPELPPPAETATAFYRILQEILTNVARHAQASYVVVEFESLAEHWSLTVIDNGVGLGSTAGAGSLGLLGMRERAEMLGGSVTVRNGEPRGVMVRVRIPKAP